MTAESGKNKGWSAWIDRTDESVDVVTAGMVEGLAATLDSEPRPHADGLAPQGIHWLLAPARAPMHALGPDGHPARGGFLPPIDLPRRMWAASDVRFMAPIAVGDTVQRVSQIASVEAKQGSSGALVFVGVDHTSRVDGRDVVRERQTIVYRDIQPTVPGPGEAEAPAEFERRLVPGTVMLFRYSALTFNGHRIHYDRRYATEVEFYPDLVVHGPLTASLLLDLCAGAVGDNKLTRFSFRGVAPAFVDEPLRLAGSRRDNDIALTASAADGRVVMRATAQLA